MIKFKFIILIFWTAILYNSCITIPNQHKGFPPGIWRGIIYIDEFKDLIVTQGRNEVVTRDVNYESKSKFVPFNFRIHKDSLGNPVLTVLNGDEQIIFKDISFGKDRRTGDDTFKINLTPYDACLKGVFQEDKMRGYFIVNDKKDYYMPFEARYGQAHRFTKVPEKATVDLNGTYQVVFSDTTKDRFDAVGEFIQQDQKLTGTFRTETGDFRYLEGVVEGNKFALSCFDGAHAFLFEGELSGDSISGMYYSGKHFKTNWHGHKTKNGILKAADASSFSKQSLNDFLFKFSTPEGKVIDFASKELSNKVKIVQIMGSWCPNCKDESIFLNSLITENKFSDLYIVGLAFERYADKEKAMNRIKNYKTSMNLNYEIAYGGLANKDSAAMVLPQLSGISAYPTTLFVDRQNKIYKVHTGFEGPATSKYEDYKREFLETLNTLLNSK